MWHTVLKALHILTQSLQTQEIIATITHIFQAIELKHRGIPQKTIKMPCPRSLNWLVVELGLNLR